MKHLVVRLLIALGISLFAFIALLGIEVTIARRGAELEPYPERELDLRANTSDGAATTMVWIGDSTGAGVGASSAANALPRIVAAGLNRSIDLRVPAISGARVSDAIETQLPALARLQPDLVIVAIGSNDVVHLTPRGRFRAQLETLLTGVEAVHPSHIVILGPGQFAGTPRFAQPLRAIAGWRAQLLNDDVRTIARAHHALFVDIIERVGKYFVGDPVRYHAVDRFHPNDAGYQLWARATLDAISEAGLFD